MHTSLPQHWLLLSQDPPQVGVLSPCWGGVYGMHSWDDAQISPDSHWLLSVHVPHVLTYPQSSGHTLQPSALSHHPSPQQL